MSQYAARYRAARAYADLSQDKLAGRLGIDAQTIKRRESGKQDPKKAELIAVAAVCDVPLEFMEGGWGSLTRDEMAGLVGEQNGLLARQSEILQEIKDEQARLRRLVSTQESAARQMEEAAEMLRTVDPLPLPPEPSPAPTGKSRPAS